MIDNLILLNRINGADGNYIMPELTIEQMSGLAQGEKLEPEPFEELAAWHELAVASSGVAYEIDPEDLLKYTHFLVVMSKSRALAFGGCRTGRRRS